MPNLWMGRDRFLEPQNTRHSDNFRRVDHGTDDTKVKARAEIRAKRVATQVTLATSAACKPAVPINGGAKTSTDKDHVLSTARCFHALSVPFGRATRAATHHLSVLIVDLPQGASVARGWHKYG